jgi:branched-chain amino acid transport system permease protein
MMDSKLRASINIGLVAGVIMLGVSVIGMVETFDQRSLITGLVTLGQLLLFVPPLAAAYLAAQRSEETAPGRVLLHGSVAGLFSALPLVALIFLTVLLPNIREQLVNVSPALISILTFGQGAFVGSVLRLLANLIMGVIGSGLFLLPTRYRRPVLNGIVGMFAVAILSEVALNILRPLPRNLVGFFFGSKGIEPVTAIILLVVIPLLSIWWDMRGRTAYQERWASLPPAGQQRARRGSQLAGVIALLFLPLILGTYLTEVVDNVGIYILMGFGLNIVVGFAGLLDLGYVAFFAIGAYTMGLLTSQGPLGIAGTSFWLALPISVVAATLAGVILGTPVLRLRGDYLAIVTLGFGEIIRVLVTSDLLKPYIGGAQGILQISKPRILDFVFVQPQDFYYIILAGCAFAAFVSWRLRDARLGRRWMAMREDETVAEAMGIHLVVTKLLAFGMGAAFAGMAGAIFASRLGSIFPNSFNLLISINVLCLIIVGGMGSLPGVVVGALVLVGLPELLREFAEYRLLIYGILLIAMMIAKPEGLWPSPVRRREMRADDEQIQANKA